MKTELRNFNNKPTIFVDDEPYPSIFCSVPEKFMTNFIDAGFEIFDTHPLTPNGWVGEDMYDFSATDRAIEAYLEQKKSSRLILRFWMGYPDSARNSFDEALGGRTFGTWWTDKYTGQVAQTYKKETWPTFPSFASDNWRFDAAKALRKVIEHTEEKYGDRIFAYVPGAGSCGEWFQYNTFAIESNIDPADYSPISQKGFKDYLYLRYNGDINALNDSWNVRYASFQEAQLPLPESRFKPAVGMLRNPLQERHVLDFFEYYNSLVSDTLIEWAGVAKEACRHQKLVMAFYGYHWVNSERHSLARSGHIHLEKVLKSPDIDILVAPYMYDFREVGGVVSSQTVAASVKKSGKMVLFEMEPATSVKADWPYGNHLPQSHEESIEIMKRDTVCTLVNGAAGWYMDLMGGMYDHPELIKGLKHVRKIAEKYSPGIGHSCAQIAVVLHDKASFYFKEADPFLGPLVNMFKVWELERLGAPFDDILLSDLSDKDTEQYKLFIIPNAVYLSDCERALIKENCCKNGNTVLWCYAAGVLDDSGFSITGMQDITGIRTEYTMEPGEIIIKITEDKNVYTEGLDKGTTYGTNGTYISTDTIKEQACLNCYPGSEKGFCAAPRFWAEDDKADVLGILAGTGKAGLVVKKMNGWTSVFSSAPMVPKEILRNLAKNAGCHIYTDFLGQTLACRDYFGFYSHESGECIIRLPYKSRIREVYTDKILARFSDEINIKVKANSTFLLEYTRA